MKIKIEVEVKGVDTIDDTAISSIGADLCYTIEETIDDSSAEVTSFEVSS